MMLEVVELTRQWPKTVVQDEGEAEKVTLSANFPHLRSIERKVKILLMISFHKEGNLDFLL